MPFPCRYAALAALGLACLLSGCAERPMAVPSTARLMTEGNGDKLTFRPTQHGRVYVSDRSQDKIIYQAEVHRGDVVEVMPRADRIMVGGRVISELPLDEGHQFRIFFEPIPAAARPAGFHIDGTPR